MTEHIDNLIPGPGERVLTAGRSRTGKSSFMDWEIRAVQDTRPHCMQILVDTKPRFRAEKIRGPVLYKNRRDAKKLYESWAKGPVVPNSVLVPIHDDHPFRGLWHKDNPSEIAILQSGEAEDWLLMLRLLKQFCAAHIKGRERRIVVDEALDFYQRTTWSIDPRNDVFYRTARAGGERSIGLELGAHRIHGLPPLVLNMLSRVNLFHLADDSDLIHLRRSVGIKDAESPSGDWIFRQWRVAPGGKLSEPFTGRATYPDSYLAQLSASLGGINGARKTRSTASVRICDHIHGYRDDCGSRLAIR